MTSSNRILVVDDDDAIQTLLDVLLLRQGFAVERASDGGEALKKLRRRSYEVVLLDIMMPRVNGFEVLQELRCVRPEMLRRTIVFTAASDRTLAHFDEGQVFRLIRKPFDIGVITTALEDCIAAHGSGGPHAGKPLRRSSAAK
jgi:DNA-binding response OmpR family regulator